MNNSVLNIADLTGNQHKWLKHYIKLCERGKERGLNKKELDFYSEKHHINPRCLGGSNDNENLVLLTPEEHFVAHQLLVKIYPNVFGIVNTMVYMRDTKHRNNKIYGWIKKRLSEAQSKRQLGRTKETCPSVAKQAKTTTGRTKHTHAYKAEIGRKLSLQRKGQTADKCERVAKMAKTKRGRNKYNDEAVARGAEKQRGRTKENHPGVKAQSEKMKGRTKETHPGVKAQSEKMKGRSKYTNLGLKLSSDKQRRLSNEQELYIYFLRKNSSMSWHKIWLYLSIQNVLISKSGVVKICNRVKQNLKFDVNYYKDGI